MPVSRRERETQRAALVALLRKTGPDAIGVAERVESAGATAALAAELGSDTRLLPESPEPLLAEARVAIASWRVLGLHLLTVLDNDYPENLRRVHDRPALLFVAGGAVLAGRRNGIALVGSRAPSHGGVVAARRFATEIAHAGRPVISGLALGIDAAAHRAAIDVGGETIAVIGSGHEHDYPAENASLRAALEREHAVLSPFWPATRPAAERFRRRNGVMSGLAEGTVIIEASARSGTRVQARLALAHGRPVFLRRTLLAQAWAAELSRRPGVHVVDDAGEVMAILARAEGPVTDPTE